MNFLFRKKSKRELAKVNCYVYRSTVRGLCVCIESDVEIYEDQLDKIYDIIHESGSFNPAWKIAERIVTEIGDPISRAIIEYDEKTKSIKIELMEWPCD